MHLGPSSSQLLWIMDIFGFLLAGFLITMGNSGRPDRGTAIGAPLVLAAYSGTAEMLSITRAVLDVAGGHAGALHPLADPQHVPKPGLEDKRSREFAVVEERVTEILGLTDVGLVL